MDFRRNIAFLLVLAFVTGLIYQTGTIVYFYANRAEIAARYCINKDKPQLNCHGQCHLKKQLTRPAAQAQESDSQRENLSFWLFAVELPFAVSLPVVHNPDFLVIQTRKDVLPGYLRPDYIPPDLILTL